MNDALATYQPKSNGIYLKFSDGDEVKLRVLTLDPIVSEKVWPNSPDKIDTKYGFIVWNWNENKAQVLQVGPGLLNRFTKIHRDEDFDPLNKVDIKITATGEGLERRYEVQVLPKAQELTKENVAEAANLKLEDLISDAKGRLSEFVDGDDDITVGSGSSSGYEKAKATIKSIKGEEDIVAEVDPEEEVDLSNIPF